MTDQQTADPASPQPDAAPGETCECGHNRRQHELASLPWWEKCLVDGCLCRRFTVGEPDAAQGSNAASPAEQARWRRGERTSVEHPLILGAPTAEKRQPEPAQPQPDAAHLHAHWHGPEAHTHWHQPDGHHDVQEHQPDAAQGEHHYWASRDGLCMDCGAPAEAHTDATARFQALLNAERVGCSELRAFNQCKTAERGDGCACSTRIYERWGQIHQPESAPPSAGSYRLAELEALERAVVEWRHCRVTGTDGVQLVCDHDRKLAAASRAAYRRVYPTE